MCGHWVEILHCCILHALAFLAGLRAWHTCPLALAADHDMDVCLHVVCIGCVFGLVVCLGEVIEGLAPSTAPPEG